MGLMADDLGNHETEFKIFLAPSASATDSPATGCDIVLRTDPATGISSGSLEVVNRTLLYSENSCWSSTYGSKGYHEFSVKSSVTDGPSTFDLILYGYLL